MTQESKLADALAHVREDEVEAGVKMLIDAGTKPTDIVAECNRGMVALGNRFARGECFVPDLMYGGMILKNVMEKLGPMLTGSEAVKTVGIVVMGTVQHDVHDIGKDIVTMMLRGVGFEVIDLGVDVPPEKFVEAIGQHQPKLVGMSVLLTTCFKSVIATVEALKEAGLREDRALMVGGAAASDLLRENAGCDFYGSTAVDGVNFASKLVGVQ